MDAGGLHQRHAKRQKLSRGVVPDDNNDGTEIGAPMVIDSHEAFAWLKTWAWGGMSSSAVQESAMLAYKDQFKLLQRFGISEDYIPVSLRKLARLGSWGEHQGNVNRDLK